MIAVTIGVGLYESMAHYAAQAVSDMTGLDAVVLGTADYNKSGCALPHFLKLKLFDFIEEESILYFDADMVCLNQWNPRDYEHRNAVLCVAERRHPAIVEACKLWDIPLDEYVNTGMLLLRRSLHREWFEKTDHFIRSSPVLPLFDQTPLNFLRHRLKIQYELLDRRYNWIGFGEGSLCYKVPVFMAHTIKPPSKTANVDFFEGRYDPPILLSMKYSESEIAQIAGCTLQSVGINTVTRFMLRNDGTFSCENNLIDAHYWFVYETSAGGMLVFASETEIAQEYKKTGDARWSPTRQSLVYFLMCDLVVGN